MMKRNKKGLGRTKRDRTAGTEGEKSRWPGQRRVWTAWEVTEQVRMNTNSVGTNLMGRTGTESSHTVIFQFIQSSTFLVSFLQVCTVLFRPASSQICPSANPPVPSCSVRSCPILSCSVPARTIPYNTGFGIKGWNGSKMYVTRGDGKERTGGDKSVWVRAGLYRAGGE